MLENNVVTDLVNIFEVFLPQLLLYPNPTSPLNGEAAALLMRNKDLYDQKVKGKCSKRGVNVHFLVVKPLMSI